MQGSARLADDRVRLTVRLVQARDGVALWSQEYDGERSRHLRPRGGYRRKIAAALKVPAGPARRWCAAAPAISTPIWISCAPRWRRASAAPRPLADAAVLLEKVVTREPDFAPAAALLAYSYALTPLFAPSLRGGMPEEERKIVERTIPSSDALARRATRLDPKSAEGFVALGYANMVQRRMVAAEDAFRQALALNPNQADGLHGLSQLLAALGRIEESLAMREHLQAGEQSIINYTADTAEIYLARRRYREGGRHAAAVPPGPHARARAGAGLGRPLSRSRGGDPRDAGVELSARDAGGGGEDSRFRAGQGGRARRRCRGSAI